MRTLWSHGGFPVACPGCGGYSYLPHSRYFIYLSLYVSGIAAVLLGLVLHTWLPVLIYGALLFVRVAWLAFGAPMLPVEASEASVRRSFGWLGIALAVAVILLALASGFHRHST